jgi:hypothetical protein
MRWNSTQPAQPYAIIPIIMTAIYVAAGGMTLGAFSVDDGVNQVLGNITTCIYFVAVASGSEGLLPKKIIKKSPSPFYFLIE